MHSTTPNTPAPTAFDFKGTDVRTLIINDEPWFVLPDVCKVLEMSNPSMVKNRLIGDNPDALSTTEVIDSMGRKQAATIINESGLYDVILDSRKPQAKEFRRWVTSEVIPSIRKTGSYGAPAELSGPELMAKALLEANNTLQALEATNRRQAEELQSAAPKAEAYDTFIDGDGTYSVGNVAKMLGLSQNKLFDRLRSVGVLISKGAMRNTPYQKYMHHFAVKAYDYERSNGERATSYTTRVQPSGIAFIQRKLEQPELKAVTA